MSFGTISKNNIPYYKVAKHALVNWNGLSEEEAEKIINEQSFEEIEAQVDAKSSIDYAIEGIKESLNLNDKYEKALSNLAYEGGQGYGFLLTGIRSMLPSPNYGLGSERSKEQKEKVNNCILDTLFHVHDGWVKREKNIGKFEARERKHQHMPSELIGWKEVMSDMVFVKPIFEALGVEVNEEELEQAYDSRVKDFFLDRQIKTTEDLVGLITKGEEFYPPLAGYGETLEKIKDTEYAREKIIPAIAQNGIGDIEQLRVKIFHEIVENPEPKDIARLSDDEKELVEARLEQRVNALIQERDELKEKNAVIDRIMALSKKRDELKQEIAIEENKRKQNIDHFND